MSKYNKKRSVKKSKSLGKPNINLGDDDTCSDSLEDDSSLAFDTPERNDEATDYGLEFTHTNVGDPLHHRRRARLHQDEAQTPLRASDSRAAPAQVGVVPRANIRNSSTYLSSTNESPNRAIVQTGPKKLPQQSALVRKPRKQKNPMQRDRTFAKEVLALQVRKDNLMPRLPFARLVREIMNQFSHEVSKITRTALEALQESTEMYLTQQLQDAYTLTLHRGRVTLCVSDMELLRFIRGRDKTAA